MRKRNFDYSYLIIQAPFVCVFRGQGYVSRICTMGHYIPRYIHTWGSLPYLVNFYTCTFIHGARARTKNPFQGDTFLFAFEGSIPVVVQLVAIVAMGGVFRRYMCKNVASCLLARGYMISSILKRGGKMTQFCLIHQAKEARPYSLMVFASSSPEAQGDTKSIILPEARQYSKSIDLTPDAILYSLY